MLSSTERPEPAQSKPTSDERPADASGPKLADALAMAESLDPNDRMRLIAGVWETLPPKNRAAFIAFGIENIHVPDGDEPRAADLKPAEPTGPTVWDFLFDPARTPGLYSAPRRFDLATIFVVTAAFSILFGAMSAIGYFGPITEVIVGLLIAVVAAAQAYYQHTANPRGVSIVSGAIALSIMLVVLQIAQPRLLAEPGFVVVVIYGLCGGAISGYLAGVLVGGVFLVADIVRRRYARPPDQTHDNEVVADQDSSDQGESPWTD
jgi:hypothetical protein